MRNEKKKKKWYAWVYCIWSVLIYIEKKLIIEVVMNILYREVLLTSEVFLCHWQWQ